MRRTLRMTLLAHPGRAVDPVPAPISLADDVLSAPVSLEAIEIPAAANDVGSGGGVRITAVTAVGALPQANLSIVGTAPSQRIRIERAGLAIGTYVGTYDAELVSDPSIRAVADFTLNLTSTALSSIIVTAPSPATLAEGNSGTKSIAFIVSRQGGPVTGLQRAVGTRGRSQRGGHGGWAGHRRHPGLGANDGTARTVTIVVKGDTTVEPDEVCRIRLSSPVGCAIGMATATVTIQNDDEAPANATMDLAYNGLMLGAACHYGEPGNKEIRNRTNNSWHAIVMYLEHMDPIVAIQTENRCDHFPLGSTDGGYSDNVVVRVKATSQIRGAWGKSQHGGNNDTLANVDILQMPQGGDIRWRVAKVASADSSTGALTFVIPPGQTDPWVGETRRIIRCALDASWQGERERSDGDGPCPPSFGATADGGAYPTIWFINPIDPRALGWSIGDRIAFVIDNSAADDGTSSGQAVTANGPMAPDLSGQKRWQGGTRYASVNLSYAANRPDVNRSSCRLMRNVGAWWARYAQEDEYFPVFAIGHKRANGPMIVKGNAYIGYAGAGQYLIQANERYRQVIKIPNNQGWGGRTIRAVDASLWRWNATGTLAIRLYRAGSTVGGQDAARSSWRRRWRPATSTTPPATSSAAATTRSRRPLSRTGRCSRLQTS